jgi:hypothetical protein
VPENTLRLEAREFKPIVRHRPRSNREASIDSKIFYSIYSKVAAFTTKLRRQNEAIETFQATRIELEALLRKYIVLGQEELGTRTEHVANTIAAYHSLLALLHWLYPGKDYDRLKNANAMYQHSVGATDFAQTPFSESYMLGLFIQLRILPFLIRSNKPLTKELAKTREKAILLISILDSAPRRPFSKSRLNSKHVLREGEVLKDLAQERTHGFKGLLHEGLGFSYWQLERNSEIALDHLERSINSIVEANKETGPKSDHAENKKERRTTSSSFTKKVKPTYAKNKAERSFYNAFTSVAFWDLGLCHEGLADKLEGDDRMRLIKKARADYEKSYSFAKKTTWNNYKGLSAYMIASTYEWEAEREIEKNRIRQLLRKAIKVGDEALHWLSLWSTDESDFLAGSWIAAYYGRLADYSSPNQRRSYMLHSLKLAKRAEDLITKHESSLGGKLFTRAQIGDLFIRNADYYRQLATNQKTTLDYSTPDIQKERELVIEPLRKSLEYATRSKFYYKEGRFNRFNKQAAHACLLAAEVCYELSSSNIHEDEKKAFWMIGKGACREAKAISKKNDWNEAVAESNWLLAQLQDLEAKYHQSAASYLEANGFYERAKNFSEHGSKVYQDFADYMLAWNKIELAKVAHVSSNFSEAADLYLKAANLISKTREWSGESEVFFAESLIELGESKSLREEKASEAIELFDEAISGLSKNTEEMKKYATLYSPGYGVLAQNLITFCRARIILEKSKEAYRLGDFEKSILGLSNAETMFEDLAANPVVSDSLRSNELRSMGSLCRALASFQKAQLKNDPELYLEARRIFGSSAEESKSRTLRPLLSGLASFASFLFYSNQVEKSLDTKLDFDLVEECNKALEGAKSSFKKVGNKSFLNILKASEHILDATIKMNSADREVEDVQVKARLYAEAQRSLSLASKYYKLVGSSKRLTDALHLIKTVRNQQNLIPLAHDIIAEVASNQIIYAAIASSSVMEKTPQTSPSRSATSYVALDSEISKAYTQSGEVCVISYTVSNLGRDPVTAVKIDEILPEGFDITESPIGKLTGRSLKLNLRIDAGTSTLFSIRYVPRSTGEFSWNPSLIFLDASRTFKVARSRVVHSVVEPGKTIDFVNLLRSKSILETNLQATKQKLLEVQSTPESNIDKTGLEAKLTEELYSIKEKISRIEEEFLRTKNEYDLMVEELRRIRSDIEMIKHRRVSSTFGGDSDDSANLLAEEKLLEARIERRRLQLEQARLL